LLELDYTYGTTSNNGNVLTQQIVIQGSLDVKQTYTYDICNRLATATETPTGSQTVNWKQTFTYDPYGNRNFDTNSNNTFPQAVVGANPTISQTNNRITSVNYHYDAVGNLDQEPDLINQQNLRNYTYDAENH
jgi:hypothetical protein